MPTIRNSISRLADSFPVGANKKRTDILVDRLERKRKQVIDVDAAVEHLIDHREQATFPTIAQVLSAIRTSRTARLTSQADQTKRDEPTPRPLTSDEIDQVRKVRQLAAEGIYWCGREGRFVKGRPQAAFEVGRAGLVYQDVTRADILGAWGQEFEGKPAPPEPVGSTEDGALADLF